MLSVVITVRNRPGYLRQCIDALLRQSLDRARFEIVVVDDASEDDTWKVVSEYAFRRKHAPPKVLAKRLLRRRGPGLARNIGNGMAHGDIIVVQDSDDISLPNRLQVIEDYFRDHPHVDLFFSGANMVRADLKHMQYHHARHHYWKILESQQLIWHPTMAYRRSILSCAGGPVSYPSDLADVDYGFLLDAKKAGVRYGLYDQPLVLYRNHPGQISRADHALQQKLAQEKRAKARG
jgi:glycosyltransferase involved in cell wall biosynthesis